MREMALGLAASFFFAVTFILNRSMGLAGGSWAWSSSLRFFFMVPLLFAILLARRNLGPVWHDMKCHPWTWITWGTVGDLKCVYRGQLDDSRPNNGIPVTGESIRTALDALLEGRPVPEKQKPSIGCSIKWKQAL